MDGQHYANLLEEIISVIDFRVFFSLSLLGKPKELSYNGIVFPYTVRKLHNHIQNKEFYLTKYFKLH